MQPRPNALKAELNGGRSTLLFVSRANLGALSVGEQREANRPRNVPIRKLGRTTYVE
jgi:hypothetical protein